ncbi:MAG: hypothetical protein ABTR07_00180 [Candidatus Competibacter denitrificans]
MLQQRGHTVALLANPHFTEAVAQAGLSLVPLGTEAEYLAALRQPEIWHPRRGFAVIWRQLMELTPRLLAPRYFNQLAYFYLKPMQFA